MYENPTMQQFKRSNEILKYGILNWSGSSKQNKINTK